MCLRANPLPGSTRRETIEAGEFILSLPIDVKVVTDSAAFCRLFKSGPEEDELAQV
jgi:hypothetical protein